jgi:uncharacterized OB-fold protein
MSDTTIDGSGVNIDMAQRQVLPQPGWVPAAEPYWFAAKRRELTLQQCRNCGAHRWPISSACYNCQSPDSTWVPVAGTGRVFSYTWADFPPPPDGKDRNITVVELDQTDGPDPVRMISWVIDVQRDQLQCDLPIEVTFLDVDDEVAVPAWRPRPVST